jgi:hypothetical protein
MPLSITDLAANEKSLFIPIGDDGIKLVYYPNRMTSKLLLHMDDVYDGTREELGIHEALVELIKSWDLTDGDGNPYPITATALAKLGIPVLRVITTAIGNDSRPN